MALWPRSCIYILRYSNLFSFLFPYRLISKKCWSVADWLKFFSTGRQQNRKLNVWRNLVVGGTIWSTFTCAPLFRLSWKIPLNLNSSGTRIIRIYITRLDPPLRVWWNVSTPPQRNLVTNQRSSMKSWNGYEKSPWMECKIPHLPNVHAYLLARLLLCAVLAVWSHIKAKMMPGWWFLVQSSLCLSELWFSSISFHIGRNSASSVSILSYLRNLNHIFARKFFGARYFSISVGRCSPCCITLLQLHGTVFRLFISGPNEQLTMRKCLIESSTSRNSNSFIWFSLRRLHYLVSLGSFH